jgi:hypothetical protein
MREQGVWVEMGACEMVTELDAGNEEVKESCVVEEYKFMLASTIYTAWVTKLC